jgi:uncharacterized membrane protein YesL
MNSNQTGKNQNSKIFKPMTPKKSGQFLLLGLLWLLFCIPVITIGAATCSVFYVALKILNNDEDVNVWKSFIKGIKENFLQGFLMFLLSIITLGAAAAYIWWVLERSSQGILLVCFAIGISFVVLVFNIFTYPIIGRYKNTFANILRNAVALAFTFGKQTLRVTIFTIAELAIAGVLFKLNLFAGLASLLFWPSLVFYTISSFMADIFYKVENPVKYEDEAEEASDENEDKTAEDTVSDTVNDTEENQNTENNNQDEEIES